MNQQVQIKERQRGYDEATFVESFVIAVGGAGERLGSEGIEGPDPEEELAASGGCEGETPPMGRKGRIFTGPAFLRSCS